jgi:hypothetical protein
MRHFQLQSQKALESLMGLLHHTKVAEDLQNLFDYSMAICKFLTPPSQLHVTAKKKRQFRIVRK